VVILIKKVMLLKEINAYEIFPCKVVKKRMKWYHTEVKDLKKISVLHKNGAGF